jgi:hypothetical protein
MKASMDRGQIMGVVGGGGLLLIAAGLAWLGLGALGEKQVEAQALAERMGNPALAALMSDSDGSARAGRETAELRKLEKELREKHGVSLEAWSKGTQEAAGEGQAWAKDPGAWKDRLIEVQSRLQKEALANKVKLGPDFYLGLEAFRQKSPTAEEVPALAIHLSVAERLVDRLIEARKIVEQYPTVCEFRSLLAPGMVAENSLVGGGGAAAPKPRTPPAGPERKSFRVEIQCSPEVLYDYVQGLTRDSWLFIITDLSVTNEKQTFPLRSEIAKKFAVSEAAPGSSVTAEKKEKKLLEILAGEESLVATMEVDFVAWKNPKEAKAVMPPAQAP